VRLTRWFESFERVRRPPCILPQARDGPGGKWMSRGSPKSESYKLQYTGERGIDCDGGGADRFSPLPNQARQSRASPGNNPAAQLPLGIHTWRFHAFRTHNTAGKKIFILSSSTFSCQQSRLSESPSLRNPTL